MEKPNLAHVSTSLKLAILPNSGVLLFHPVAKYYGRHIAHVGWDPEKGFDMKNVDPSWAELFSELGKYGIKVEDIKDPETAKFLVNYVKDRGGLKAKPEGVTEKPKPERRGAPPPPPPRKKHLQASTAAVSVQPPAISPTLPIRAPMPTRPVATSPALPARAIPSPLPRSERVEDEQPITRTSIFLNLLICAFIRNKAQLSNSATTTTTTTSNGFS